MKLYFRRPWSIYNRSSLHQYQKISSVRISKNPVFCCTRDSHIDLLRIFYKQSSTGSQKRTHFLPAQKKRNMIIIFYLIQKLVEMNDGFGVILNFVRQYFQKFCSSGRLPCKFSSLLLSSYLVWHQCDAGIIKIDLKPLWKSVWRMLKKLTQNCYTSQLIHDSLYSQRTTYPSRELYAKPCLMMLYLSYQGHLYL